MNSILCAIRAGQGSRAVQQAAIHAAQETGAPLIFLHVVDKRTIDACEESLRPFVRDELYWMGKSLLRIAGQRAHAAGLRDVELLIYEGELREELRRAVGERNAGCLLLGAPKLDRADEWERFASQLRETTGVPVEIVMTPARLNAPGQQ